MTIFINKHIQSNYMNKYLTKGFLVLNNACLLNHYPIVNRPTPSICFQKARRARSSILRWFSLKIKDIRIHIKSRFLFTSELRNVFTQLSTMLWMLNLRCICNTLQQFTLLGLRSYQLQLQMYLTSITEVIADSREG